MDEEDEEEKKTVRFVIRKIYLKAVAVYRQGSTKIKIGISILPVEKTPKTPSRGPEIMKPSQSEIYLVFVSSDTSVDCHAIWYGTQRV